MTYPGIGKSTLWHVGTEAEPKEALREMRRVCRFESNGSAR